MIHVVKEKQPLIIKPDGVWKFCVVWWENEAMHSITYTGEQAIERATDLANAIQGDCARCDYAALDATKSPCPTQG